MSKNVVAIGGSRGAKENFSRPAIDPLFRSAAVALGARVLGVILSGDLDDGAAGLAFVRAFGGRTLIQNPHEADASSMPRAAMEAAGADAMAGPAELGETIVAMLRAGTQGERRSVHAGERHASTANRGRRGGNLDRQL